MAFAIVYFNDGQKKTTTPEKGLQLWLGLNGEITPTEQQAAYLDKVANVFLPPSIAPDSYVEAHKDLRERMAAGKQPKHNLTHEGIHQSMYDAIPTGDR